MNPSDALPGYDKAGIKTAIGFFQALFRVKDMQDERAVPAIVTDYNERTGYVTVRPMPQYSFDTAEGEVSADREEVTVRMFRQFYGGYIISIPILKGDTGWLIAGDRKCEAAIGKNSELIDKDLKDGDLKGRTHAPDDCAMMNFGNGFFIPFSFANKPDTIGRSFVIRKYRKEDEGEEDFTEIRIDDDVICLKSKKVSAKISPSAVEIVRDDEKLTLDDNGLSFDGKKDEDVTMLTGLRYDIASHQIQIKSRPCEKRGTMITKTGAETGWTVVDGGQAVPEQTSGN